MNCRTATDWLLVARPAVPLPPEVGAHLHGCPACAALRQRLMQVEDNSRAIPVPPPSSDGRQRLEERLARLPAPAQIPSRAKWLSRGAAALAAAILIGLGFLLGRYTGPQGSSDPKAPATEAVQNDSGRPAGEPLLVRVAELASSLSGEESLEQRMQIVMSLAEELRIEAQRLARRGEVNDLACLARLYDRTLSEEVAMGLPVQRARLRLHLANATEELAAEEKGLPPALAAHLEPFLASARRAAKLAEGGAIKLPDQEVRAKDPPLDGMVALVLRLAKEDAPLPRAETSAELAEVLARATVLLNVSGQAALSERMGGYLDEVMGRGVADNLDRVEEQDRGGSYKQAVAKVREKAGQAPAVLEANLALSPPAVQHGLQRALEASRYGQERAKGGKSNGNGPPWSRPELKSKDRTPPPGWMKKRNWAPDER